MNANVHKDDLDITEQQQVIARINEYLYTNYEGIGTTHALDDEFEYFSEFHKYWEKYHRQILNPQIDERQCVIIANCLHDIYVKYGESTFKELYDTHSLKNEEICKIRLFTANQDFRGSREFGDFATIYNQDPSIFHVQFIYENPEKFVGHLKLGTLSQGDKRIKYAQTAAELLVENHLEPIDLLKFHGNDFLKLRKTLIESGAGYGNKKADMFLRDMKLLCVWPDGKNFDKIDVASDVNTIRVALRTGILKTDILLLSSFLDIFCYQYGLMDEMNAKAWRRVWEIWSEKYPNETVESPCLMDYLIYRVIGKEICKERLFKFKCEEVGHEFYWHSSRNRTCQLCFQNRKRRVTARLLSRELPCKSDEGKITLQNNRNVTKVLADVTQCPFIAACNPRSDKFRKLNPPKSISILGQTGWESARTRHDEGGGGLMA